jgi:hypothetical protein
MKKLKSKDVSYANKDLDTGKETEMGEYKLADKAYYKLLKQIKRNKFADVDEGLKKNLDAFYGNRMASPVYGTNSRKGKKITLALEQLNTVQEFSGNQ